jgi:peptidoglycan/xylan/chitin deacetylase (PgdA/CDA1 family)
MPLRGLLTALREGTLPDRAVAVTLDDGYADNLENAKPLLERYEVPATVFVTTAHLGQQREFWWDDLERLLLLPGRLPATLRLRIGRTAHEWHLGDADVYGEAESGRHADWNVESEDPTRRHRAYRDLCRRLRGVPVEVRDAVLDELREIAGVSSPGRPTHRALSPEGVARLTEGGVVDVGAHTVTHPLLSALPLAVQRAEIAESKARLQEITGREITSFAYPFGGRADYTPATVALVQETGFSLACSNVHGLVRRGSDRFQLPRELVRDWDGETFARRLREWLSG